MTESTPPRSIGIVKWFDDRKGFGFAINNEGKDVFLHHSRIEKFKVGMLPDGQKISYLEIKGTKGLEARDIKIAE